MASARFGHLDAFTQKNNKVGIGTSTATEKLEIVGGTKSKDLKRVASIPTLVLELWTKEYNGTNNWFALKKEEQQKTSLLHEVCLFNTTYCRPYYFI